MRQTGGDRGRERIWGMRVEYGRHWKRNKVRQTDTEPEKYLDL